MIRRIFHSLSFLILLLIASTSCSTDKKASSEDIAKAAALGRERALELAPPAIGQDTLAMESILLDVREREERLRRAGYNDMADSYIDGFLQTLDSVNPALASEIR